MRVLHISTRYTSPTRRGKGYLSTAQSMGQEGGATSSSRRSAARASEPACNTAAPRYYFPRQGKQRRSPDTRHKKLRWYRSRSWRTHSEVGMGPGCGRRGRRGTRRGLALPLRPGSSIARFSTAYR
eukprot:383610-Rhodomonas_salina.1